MKKIGLLFPGQGSQYVGMCKEFYEKYNSAKEFFKRADAILGYNLEKKIFEGPLEELSQTKITQPAIFTVSIICFNILLENYPLFDNFEIYAAGHSLGEYSALYSVKVFDFDTGLYLVKKRAEFISEASERNPGKMAAIIGLQFDKLKKICNNIKNFGVIEMVNFNSPEQIVISGETKAIEAAVKLATEEGAIKAIILNVSGPFHSSLMTYASELMAKELDKVVLNNTRNGFIVTNYDAEIVSDNNKIKQNLIKQINNPVLWEKSIRKIIAQNIDTFIEIGPNKILSSLLRRIDRNLRIFNIENTISLENTLKHLKSINN
jgi:[acyl-carrier-protein] S-malonyltransferase